MRLAVSLSVAILASPALASPALPEAADKDVKSRGTPVEYILFPDEGHGWRKVPNRVRSTTAMVDFFRRHLGAPAAP